MWGRIISDNEVKELPLKTRKIFLCYYNIAEGSITHPRDYQRFNEFIRYCHAKGVKLDEHGFNQLLVRLGQTPEYATKLSSLYAHGRSLLKVTCP